MRIIVVHNRYGAHSGEERAVDSLVELLLSHGHRVERMEKSSVGVLGDRRMEFGAFFSGLYSPGARKAFNALAESFHPDIVHVHNLYPLVSPSVLDAARARSLPVVMTVHNYRLICPNALLFSRGEACERCTGGREYWCVLRDCEESFPKSLGYALRNAVARIRGNFRRGVDRFLCFTRFQKQKLESAGFPGDRISILPGFAVPPADPIPEGDRKVIGFIGRISPEKGVGLFMDAASRLPDLSFKAAGAYSRMPWLPSRASSNLEFLGPLGAQARDEFYRSLRMLILTSRCYEVFPLVIVEAMHRGIPVIAPRHGGLPEIVEDGTTGLLYEPGKVADLVSKIQRLWSSPRDCDRMSGQALRKAKREYGPAPYYARLSAVYRSLLEEGRNPGKEEC